MVRKVLLLVFALSSLSQAFGGPYRNQEKYWWYRYRLVNDFLKVGGQCGESIPAELRQMYWNDAAGRDENRVCWGDATQHLGAYINMLAGEYRILLNNGMSTRRTLEELYFALNAVDRLDANAEPYSRDLDGSYPCGAPDPNNPNDLNGFLIRDDVPMHDEPTLGFKSFVNQNFAHFNRPGIPYLKTRQNNNTISDYGSRVNTPNHVVNWTSGAKKVPIEESQDQLVQLYMGLGIVPGLVGYSPAYNGVGLADKAAKSVFRMYWYVPHNNCSGLFRPWTICNPVRNSCVYGLDPGNNCNAGGAQISCFAVGAADGFKNMRLQASSVPPPYISALIKDADFPGFWPAYQLMQFVRPTNTKHEMIYANTYAAYGNDWKGYVNFWQGFGNTTWNNLIKNSKSSNWAYPHLPLIYRLIQEGPGHGLRFNPGDKPFSVISYPKLFDNSPFCGAHNYYSNWGPKKTRSSTGNTWGDNEDFPGQDAFYWSNAKVLQDYFNRGNEGVNNSDFNNLDYMTVWNLYNLVEKDYTSKQFNSYYREDYSYSWGFNRPGALGTQANKLLLQFLEYVSMVNSIGPLAHVRIRGAKVIDLKPGFNTEPGAVFEAYIKDYYCQEEGYYYALSNSGYIEAPAGRSAGPSSNGEDVYYPLDEAPDGVDYHVEYDDNPDYDGSELNDYEDPKLTQQYFDSLLNQVHQSGDPELIAYVDSMLKDEPAFQGKVKVVTGKSANIYPNPSNGAFTITTSGISSYDLRILNTLGQRVFAQNNVTGPSFRFSTNGVLSSGTYLVEIKSEGFKETRKVTIF